MGIDWEIRESFPETGVIPGIKLRPNFEVPVRTQPPTHSPDDEGRSGLGDLGLLPTEAHRAFLRLILDGTVARHHLGSTHTSGWPGFVAVGPTKTAKSLGALAALAILGLDSARHLRSTPSETERGLWGRRYNGTGGHWWVRPAWILSEPLVVLDEYDKAPMPVQRASLKLLQGEIQVPGEEGELITVAPTVVVLANAGVEILPPEYRRRSVVLDTTGLPMPNDLSKRARAFLSAPGRLSLDDLVPPVDTLPDDLAETLTDVLRDGLTEEGWRLVDERAIGYLALGRAAITGASLYDCVMAVVGDYLEVAATTGHTKRPIPHVLPDAPERQARSEVDAERERQERLAKRRARLELASSKAALIAELDDARTKVDPPYLGMLAQLTEWAEDAESVAELDEIRGLAAEVVQSEFLPAAMDCEPSDGDLEAELDLAGRREETLGFIDFLFDRLDEYYGNTWRILYTKGRLRWHIDYLRSARSLAEFERAAERARPDIQKALDALLVAKEQLKADEEAERLRQQATIDDQRFAALQDIRNGKCPLGYETQSPVDVLLDLEALTVFDRVAVIRNVLMFTVHAGDERRFYDRLGRLWNESHLQQWSSFPVRQVATAALTNTLPVVTPEVVPAEDRRLPKDLFQRQIGQPTVIYNQLY